MRKASETGGGSPVGGVRVGARAAADYLPTRFWLMKTEPDVFSFADLLARPGRKERWDGVRNYQARNFMRDSMSVGDWVVFYHSNAEPAGVAGLARVVEKASPDLTALDPVSPYFDPKATSEDPRWCCVTVGEPVPLARFVPLDALRSEATLADMLLLRNGQRLSILPLDETEFRALVRLAGGQPEALPFDTPAATPAPLGRAVLEGIGARDRVVTKGRVGPRSHRTGQDSKTTDPSKETKVRAAPAAGPRGNPRPPARRAATAEKSK